MSWFSMWQLMMSLPKPTAEHRAYGEATDNVDDKTMLRRKYRCPELHGSSGSGIPDEHLPFVENSRDGGSGFQSSAEQSSASGPQKGAMGAVSFGGGDAYSPILSAAPYSKPSKISEVPSGENQYLNRIYKYPGTGNVETRVFEKNAKFDFNDSRNNTNLCVNLRKGGPMDGGSSSTGEDEEELTGCCDWYVKDGHDRPMGGQQSGGGGETQAGGGGEGAAKYQCLSDEHLFFAVCEPRGKDGGSGGQQTGAGGGGGDSARQNRGKKPKPKAYIRILKDKIVIGVGKNSTITITEKSIISKNPQKVATDGPTFLGDPNAKRQVSAIGTGDSEYNQDNTNLLKKVRGI